MKKVALKYGLYSAVLILILFAISFFALMSTLSMQAQEVFGYLSMFISLLFVFFGIKSYRDNQGKGSISFGKGLGLGMLITLIPAFVFAAFDTIYVTLINPGFFDEYVESSKLQLQKQFSGAELTAKIEEMENMMELASNPFFSFFLMFITVVMIGFIISLISSFILRKADRKTA